jgi:hypothetical protein
VLLAIIGQDWTIRDAVCSTRGKGCDHIETLSKSEQSAAGVPFNSRCEAVTHHDPEQCSQDNAVNGLSA